MPHQSDEDDFFGTICMAVYRPDPDLLKVQLDSIKAQSVKTWRCLVGIDGTDPATAALLRAAIGEDSRFTVLAFDENVGFYRNFERLLSEVEATSSWIALADQDDRWYPEKLATLLPALVNASLVTGAARVVDKDGVSSGVTARAYRGLTALMVDNQVTGSLAVFRRDLLDIALPFPEPTDVAYHDHWLGVAAASTGGVILDPRVVQDYVQHDANVIGEEESTSIVARSQALMSSSAGGPRAMIGYLRIHRWGWRVNMAHSLRSKLSTMPPSVAQVMDAFSVRGRALRASRLITIAVVTRRAPAARGCALILGALVGGAQA
ncbi:MAG: hypothetical protein ABS62_03140 [Microbacterium sp. SCN 70-200]|mgnify:CR=1 FL=1|nr:MAG: hypothetical protein ABS62_03140 [Microbacterium sp. SCN 70-200]